MAVMKLLNHKGCACICQMNPLLELSRPLGLLEVLSSGSGFVRRRESGYAPGDDDIYVPSRVIQNYGLRTGDELMGIAAEGVRAGKSPPLAYLARVNDEPPEEAQRRPEFSKLSAMHPDQQLVLECGREWRGEPELTNRVIDIFCPMGKGQRAMIVAPAKAGKTTVMQAIANTQSARPFSSPKVGTEHMLLNLAPPGSSSMGFCSVP